MIEKDIGDDKFQELYKNVESIDISCIEDKIKEISQVWEYVIQEQNSPNFYKFYRKYQDDLFEDFKKLWLLCKLRELKKWN